MKTIRKKRAVSLLIAVAMVFSVLLGAAMAEGAPSGDNDGEPITESTFIDQETDGEKEGPKEAEETETKAPLDEDATETKSPLEKATETQEKKEPMSLVKKLNGIMPTSSSGNYIDLRDSDQELQNAAGSSSGAWSFAAGAVGKVTIHDGATVTVTTGKEAVTNRQVEIASAAVRLDKAHIDMSANDNVPAIRVQDGKNATINLVGDNTLKSGGHWAGLAVNDAGTQVNITAETDASLKATGGYGGAGIGTGYGGSGGTVNISGGTITANGGQYGAGIGGGWTGGGAAVTIGGADTRVIAKGSTGTGQNGQGIGHGSSGSGQGTGSLKIEQGAYVELVTNGTGSTLELWECEIAGAGAGDLGGVYSYLKVEGGTAEPTTGSWPSAWQADSNGQIVKSGTQVELTATTTTNPGYWAVWQIEPGQETVKGRFYTMPKYGVKITWQENEMLTGNSTATLMDLRDEAYYLEYVSSVTGNWSYNDSTGVAVIHDGASVTVTTGKEAVTNRRVEIASATAVTLDKAHIDMSANDNVPAIRVQDGKNATINLVGDNTLKSGEHWAGLTLNDAGTQVNITAETGASLEATGGEYGAGIGSSSGFTCGTVTISSGTITANGGEYGAGIGSNSGSGGTVNISGGDITATGGSGGAGIGGGYNGSGGTVNISGGDITATGGQYGAGIGTGYGGSGGTVNISGGDISATGGVAGAGIGGCWLGGGAAVTIGGADTRVTAEGTLGEGIGHGEGGVSKGTGSLKIEQGAYVELVTNGTSSTLELWECEIAGAGAGDLGGVYSYLKVEGGSALPKGESAWPSAWQADSNGQIVKSGAPVELTATTTTNPGYWAVWQIEPGQETVKGKNYTMPKYGVKITWQENEMLTGNSTDTLIDLRDEAEYLEYVSGTTGNWSYNDSTDVVVIPDGATVTVTTGGEAVTNRQVEIASAAVRLDRAHIDMSANSDKSAIRVQDGENATINLVGDNTLKSGEHWAGLTVNNTAQVSITAETSASLEANGGEYGAGIGTGYGGSGGTVNISGGDISATGGVAGAGIGGGWLAGGAAVTIGGADTRVTAKGNGGEGIGHGEGGSYKGTGSLKIEQGAYVELVTNGTESTLELWECEIAGAGAGDLEGVYSFLKVEGGTAEPTTGSWPSAWQADSNGQIVKSGTEVRLNSSGIPPLQVLTGWEELTTTGVQVQDHALTMPRAAVSLQATFTDGVREVRITPQTATLQRGYALQFSADVSTALDSVDDSVSWSILGANSAGTQIDTDGNLTVDVDETATSLTVTATSNYDNRKADSVTIAVTKSELSCDAEVGLRVGEGFGVIPSNYDTTGSIGWSYDGDYLAADFSDSTKAAFTALRDGTTTISYRNSVGEEASIAVTIQKGLMIGIEAEGWSGRFDGRAHGITLKDVPEGATLHYSADGQIWQENSLAYTSVGSYTVYYRIEKDYYETVQDSAMVEIIRLTGEEELKITGVPGTIRVGDVFTLHYNADDGQKGETGWSWDEKYFSATFNSPATFTALREGTTTITYTAADGQVATLEVRIDTADESGLISAKNAEKKGSSGAGTGDNIGMWMWLMLAAIAIVVCSSTMVARKKINR